MGTFKEIGRSARQRGKARAAGELNGTYFYLQFYDQVTGAIPAGPQSSAAGLHVRPPTHGDDTTSTSDTLAGGDDTSRRSRTSSRASPEPGGSSALNLANPHQGHRDAQGDTRPAAALDDGNTSTPSRERAAIANTQGCTWTVTFEQHRHAVPRSRRSGPTPTTTAPRIRSVGDDTVAVCDADYGTCVKGDADLIKRELELLSNVGAVTVSVKPGYDGTRTATDDCAWRVTFDTRAGDAELMGIALNDTWNDTAAGRFGANAFAGGSLEPRRLEGARAGLLGANATSSALGGHFAPRSAASARAPAERGDRARSRPRSRRSTRSARSTSRAATRTRTAGTRTVTFLTNLGDVERIDFDALAHGHGARGHGRRARAGVFLPFNSLDVDNGLLLGSATIEDLSAPSWT